MQYWKGHGFGFFRGLMIHYNALFLKYGYTRNPFEITAHEQEYRFLDYCTKYGLHGIIPKVNPEVLSKIAKESPLIFKKDLDRYKGNPLAQAGSIIFCSLVTIVRPFADFLVFLISLFIPNTTEPAHH